MGTRRHFAQMDSLEIMGRDLRVHPLASDASSIVPRMRRKKGQSGTLLSISGLTLI